LNPAWTEITGFPIEGSVGRPFLDHVHPEDRRHSADKFKVLLEGGRRDFLRHEARYLTSEGGARWMEVYARLTRDEARRATGMIGTLNDVTDRKAVEAEILQASLELESLFEAFPDIFFRVDE